MPEKRKSSARLKNEVARKKLNTKADNTPSKEIQEPEPQEEELLPTRIKQDSPLPTIPHDSSLGDQTLQSIAESGVLAASLSRSHQVWLTENIFERFWAKPSKRKGWVEPPNNAKNKEKMTRAGSCQIIIEPHILDATIYSIKQPNTAAASKPAVKNPIVQYNPPAATPSSSNTSKQNTSQLSSSKQASSTKSATPAIPASRPPAPQIKPSPSKQPSTSSHKNSTPTTTSGKAPPAPSKGTTDDPVIQMLAQRASTNPELKLLMKIVASGGASSDQLKTFQGHIDELTAIIQREREQAARKPQLQPQTHSQNASQPPSIPSMASQQGKFAVSTPQQPTFITTPQPKPSTPKPPKNEITGAAIEFNEPGASGDRYLFPRNCILEILPSSRLIIASFLLVRKPTEVSGSKYKLSEEYYQPVTMRITTESQKVLDVLAKAVAPKQEVVAHMEEIFANKKRAEQVQLVLRLPLESETAEMDESSRSTPVKTGPSKPGPKKLSTAKTLPTSASALTTAFSRDKAEEKVDTWQDRHCQFCLKMVPSAATRENGYPLCQACENLQRIDRLKHPFENQGSQVYSTGSLATISGPQTLVL